MDPLTAVAPAFVELAHRIVWATVATVDPAGRPRTRVLHPIWQWDGESLVGWVATTATPLKRRHLEAQPNVSLTYWDPTQDTASAECLASWHHDDETCTWLWHHFVETPAPLGYDPAVIEPWSAGPTSPAFSALRLDPWRLRVQPAAVMDPASVATVRSWVASGGTGDRGR